MAIDGMCRRAVATGFPGPQNSGAVATRRPPSAARGRPPSSDSQTNSEEWQRGPSRETRRRSRHSRQSYRSRSSGLESTSPERRRKRDPVLRSLLETVKGLVEAQTSLTRCLDERQLAAPTAPAIEEIELQLLPDVGSFSLKERSLGEGVVQAEASVTEVTESYSEQSHDERGEGEGPSPGHLDPGGVGDSRRPGDHRGRAGILPDHPKEGDGAEWDCAGRASEGGGLRMRVTPPHYGGGGS